MKKHLLKLLLLCCTGILALSLFACVPSTEQYKVDFIVGGEVYSSRTTSGNSRVVPPSDPVIDQYIFKGWYFDENEWTKEFHPYSFEKDPIKNDIKIYAYFVFDASNHVCDKQEYIEKQSTCLTQGTKVVKCSYRECGKVYSTELLPLDTRHSGTIETVRANVVEPTCVTKGSYIEVRYCSLCEAKVYEGTKPIEIPIDNNAHKFVNVPGALHMDAESGRFNLYAHCTNSDCNFTLELNNVDVKDTNKKDPTCTASGKINYEYEVYGVKFTAEEILPATGHYLCGVAINPNNTYSETTHSNIFSKITLVADGTSCGEETVGVYNCDVCSVKNIEIKINRPHVGTWVKTADPSCFKPGTEVLASCSACGGKDLSREILPTNNHIVGDNKILIKVGDLDLFHVVNTCEKYNEGCTHYTIIYDDVPVTSEEIYSKSCTENDVIRYTYRRTAGEEYTCEVVIGSGHFIGDDRAEEHERYDAVNDVYWFDYSLVGNGITVFYNQPLTCDKWTNGKYTCSSCLEEFLVTVYRPHTGSWVTTTDATCTSEGVSTFYCDFCDYGHNGEETRVIPPKEHSYDYRLEPMNETGSSYFKLVGTCTTCPAGTIPATVLHEYVTASITISKNPTCTEEGELLHTCYYNGTVYSFTKPIDKIAHQFDGSDVWTNKRFSYADFVLSGKITLADGTKVVCVGDMNDTSKDVTAKIVCDDCGQSIDVKVYRVHTGEWQYFYNLNDPCIKKGYKILYCSYSLCGYSCREEINEENHEYTAVLTENEDGTFTVKATCSVERCGKVVEYTGLDYVAKKVITEATCQKNGVVEYTFTDSEGVSHTISSVIKDGNHVLCGVDFETLLVDGKLPDGITEIVVVGGKEHFRCEECNQLVDPTNPR